MEQLQRIRNMWQFANLCQWIYIFGEAASIDDSIDIDCVEAECLNPNSTILNDVALALLKMVSSQRGLTHESFDDQARRQYILKSPDSNPFGDEDEPRSFADLDIFTKRIEPYGWDSEDRTYYVLDDNRVYRLSEAPPSHKAASSKPTRQPRRSGKRRRISEAVDDHTTPSAMHPSLTWKIATWGYGLGLRDHLVPILEKQEEDRNRRKMKREKELQTLAKMANAKRSSRIAMKAEQRQQEEKAKIEQELLREAAATQQREEQKREKIQRELEMRLVSREQRLKKREERRLVRGESGTPASADEGSEAAGADETPLQPQSQIEIGGNAHVIKDKQDEEEGWGRSRSGAEKLLAPKLEAKLEVKLDVENNAEYAATNIEPAATNIEPTAASIEPAAANLETATVNTEPTAVVNIQVAAVNTEREVVSAEPATVIDGSI
ncbi:hypothetical protein TrVFT333_005803 [Trichoderma virens FT-333]|nr:hypothetical protein TrVFT333_005803 [Trichoderma virens FT-333]